MDFSGFYRSQGRNGGGKGARPAQKAKEENKKKNKLTKVRLIVSVW